ncbi:MAG: transcription elongation factor GreA [Christensenellales bacterium]|jgi:transcription elongation factor GreA|nr:transcription elongation factor GreA [Clostridiales bacterium]
MNEQKQPVITADGLKKLKEQLAYLQNVRRAEVAELIKTARGFGDLSENAEYDEAKNEQSKLEAEITDLENTISRAIILEDEKIRTDKVNIGTTVTVHNETLDETVDYTISGVRESDPMNNIISNESPIGMALLGNKKNQKVVVHTPQGEMTLKILKIRR